jgi:hypothetical protein
MTTSMEQSPWEAGQEISHVIGTRNSLPCSQDPATGPCPESLEVSLHPHTLLP